MAQVRSDAQGPDAQVRAGPRGSAERPVSPHLQVWRWHITMTTSILHRASIIGLYVGALILTGLFVALASGEAAYGAYVGLLGSPLGLLVLFGLTVALSYLALYSVRQSFWDFGVGFNIRTSALTSWLLIIGAVIVAVAVWALAFAGGL